MNNTPPPDPVWDAAWAWVVREHERPADADVREALQQWLAADPAHRAAYEKAARLWLLTGLVPPRHAADPDGGPD